MSKNISPSPETQQEAMKIAKATQKPGQTKEQTRLIAQGIEKGIAVYKKQQKERQRSASREKKKELKQKQRQENLPQEVESDPINPQPAVKKTSFLPWLLLGLSWILFAGEFIFRL